MFVFPKETEFQQKLIDECIKLGGFGDKIQDKFVKGKTDIWLRLPSGNRLVFIEVKLNKYIGTDIIVPNFIIPQLEYIDKLANNGVPVCAMLFVFRKPGLDRDLKIYFKIAPPLELEMKFRATLHAHNPHKIAYTFSDYTYIGDLKQVITYLDNFYERLCFKEVTNEDAKS
jgi:hypothetical protein